MNNDYLLVETNQWLGYDVYNISEIYVYSRHYEYTYFGVFVNRDIMDMPNNLQIKSIYELRIV